MKRSELRQIIREEIQRMNEAKEYYTKADLLNAYMTNEIDIDELINQAGGLDKVATKSELQAFLKNKFMISIQADTYNLSETQIIKKVKELLKRY